MTEADRLADELTGESHYYEAAVELRRLQAENEALRADAERLDWMNLAGNRYAFHLSGTWYSRKDHGSPFKKHKTIRAAIDAARAKEPTP